MTQAEQLPVTIPPGTPMLKVIPPRLVEPYLNGQRSVIAGYLYDARDCPFRDPAAYYDALGLGYPGSDFSRGMPEIYLLRWLAIDMTGSLVPPPDEPHVQASVREYYALPVPIPVGAEICRVSAAGEEPIARYDGQVWLAPARRR
ncbi:MAG: hypothetical protein J2P35_07430 [Actinobacteria bacterium]|nr:hypothetical protein [Actinomycetota bacterium]